MESPAPHSTPPWAAPRLEAVENLLNMARPAAYRDAITEVLLYVLSSSEGQELDWLQRISPELYGLFFFLKEVETAGGPNTGRG